MKPLFYSITLLTFLSIASCKKDSKSNTDTSSGSRILGSSKVAFVADFENVPALTTINAQSNVNSNSTVLASKSCSCDGTCTSNAREYTVYISKQSDFTLQITLHKNRAANTAAFYTLTGKQNFYTYWFADPINLGTPEVNGVEIILWAGGKQYEMSPEFTNATNNNKNQVLNNKIVGSSFEMTAFDANTFKGKFNCTLGESSGNLIKVKNAEFLFKLN